MSKLYFKYGTMNCGKTTMLLQTAHNYEQNGMRIILLKPKIDTKGGDKVVSRLGVERKVDFVIEKTQNIVELVSFNVRLDGHIACVLVDEAQFLTREQVNQLLSVAVSGIPVIAYGLRTDFTAKGFEGSTRLLEVAHTIDEVKTICSCGSKTMFNARKVNGEFVFEGEQVMIDNSSIVEYEPLCAKCFANKKILIEERTKIQHPAERWNGIF